MDINFTQITFLLMALLTGVFGLLLHIGEQYVPAFIAQTYRYGKCAIVAEHPLVSKFEVPKRWFRHFYILAAPTASFILLLTFSRYILGHPVPAFVNAALDLQMGSRRRALVSPESTLLAVILLNVQCWKRLYETQYVSIFSDGKMSLVHYIAGFVHYIGTLTSVVGESQGFESGSRSPFRLDRFTNVHYICALTFLIASWTQWKSNLILANLRKDKDGNVVTKAHKIPKGGLFQLISGPLQFTEIVMYSMLEIILWQSSTYHYVFLWVLINQLETAITGHTWYITKFPNYPKQRKAVIPLLL